MITILVCAHGFAPNIGGVETYTKLLAEGLAERAARRHPWSKTFRVVVVTQTPSRGHDDFQFPFQVIRRPTRMQLVRLVQNADMLHLAGPALGPMLLAWLFRKPFVVEHDGYQAVCPNGALLRHPDMVVCPGHYAAHRYHKCVRCQGSETGRLAGLRRVALTPLRRWLCRRAVRNVSGTRHVLNRVSLPNSFVMRHGVPDLARPGIRPGPMEQQSLTSVAYVGRMVRDKGIPVLLRAANLLKNEGRQFRLKLIGDGPERGNLQELARSLGLEEIIQWTGYLTGEALERELDAAQAVVMPSIWEEAAPLAALEQMMAGRVLIVSDLGGQAEEVAEAGLRFPVGNHRELAGCMRQALDDPALVDRLRSQARARALAFYRSDQMVAEHLDLYQSVIA